MNQQFLRMQQLAGIKPAKEDYNEVIDILVELHLHTNYYSEGILKENINEGIIDNLKNKFITSDDILITRERHRQHLEQCLENLKNFNKKNEDEDFDKAAEDLRLATRHLGMIVGKVDVEEILGSIFNDFCIGK